MSVDGTWEITMKTPLGSQVAVLRLSSDGPTVAGTIESRLGSGAISNGHFEGSTLSWTCSFKLPMPLTADFKATLDGETLAGKVKLGNLGEAPFKGAKV